MKFHHTSNDILIVLRPLSPAMRNGLLGGVAGLTDGQVGSGTESELAGTWNTKYRMNLLSTLRPMAQELPLNLHNINHIACNMFVEYNRRALFGLLSVNSCILEKGDYSELEAEAFYSMYRWLTDRQRTAERISETPHGNKLRNQWIYEWRASNDRSIPANVLREFFGIILRTIRTHVTSGMAFAVVEPKKFNEIVESLGSTILLPGDHTGNDLIKLIEHMRGLQWS